jgi:hypothetical protein
MLASCDHIAAKIWCCSSCFGYVGQLINVRVLFSAQSLHLPPSETSMFGAFVAEEIKSEFHVPTVLRAAVSQERSCVDVSYRSTHA